MDQYQLDADESWKIMDIYLPRLDTSVRFVASLMDIGDFDGLFLRTGARIEADGRVEVPGFPIILELDAANKKDTFANISVAMQALGDKLAFAREVIDEFEENPHFTVLPAWLTWQKDGDPAAAFRAAIVLLTGTQGVRRVSVPSPQQPCLERSLRHMKMPSERKLHGKPLDGNGVIVGIIDVGCALAHPHFLEPRTPGSDAQSPRRSRVLYLWDQTRTSGSAGWSDSHVFFGMELDKPAIDAVLADWMRADGRVDEEKVYDSLQYDLELASHGTHVMDIAAGNGGSLIGTEGMAPAADVIFVQLPTDLVDFTRPLLDDSILYGVLYIMKRARQLSKPVVINISYGGYTGPHDGTSPLPLCIDQLLAWHKDCSVVVSAGNGFEADCHASQHVRAGSRARPLRWKLRPEDPTANELDIWYDASDRFELKLTLPGEVAPLPKAVRLGQSFILERLADHKVMGWIQNVPTGPGRPNRIHIQFNPTVGESDMVAGLQPVPPGTLPSPGPAPSGVWKIDLLNYGTQDATFHAWITRDDLPRGRQQSRFDEDDADPLCTIADLATGELSICVGAYNTATGETSRYSAAGQTRDGRDKPDVIAPAEETAAGRGIVCASSRRGDPSRFNGTSAAAPHVTGLVALLLQYNRDCGYPPLSPKRIREVVKLGASPLGIIANRHQQVDPHRPQGKTHQQCMGEVMGSGRVSVEDSAAHLP